MQGDMLVDMDDKPANARGNRSLELGFGLLALASLGLGLGLYVFGDRLGFDETTGRLIASAFIVAGTLDVAVLYFWERLFRPRG